MKTKFLIRVIGPLEDRTKLYRTNYFGSEPDPVKYFINRTQIRIDENVYIFYNLAIYTICNIEQNFKHHVFSPIFFTASKVDE